MAPATQMSRMAETILSGLVIAAVYFAFFFEFVPMRSEIAQKEVLPILPIWALVSFGAYLLARLGWGLFTFRECPEAYDELQAEIKQARVELRALGVDVD